MPDDAPRDGQANDLEQLRRAKEAAEAADAAKSAFLANMSHELRTPLNGVIGMIDLLARSNLDGQQRRYVQAARESADLLLAVVNDILDLSKIEKGMLELETIDFSVTEVVEQVMSLLRRSAEDNHLMLEHYCHADLLAPLRGDPVRLRQVLVNLVANAIKFTPAGSVSVHASFADRTPAVSVVRFEVHDTGIGIPKADRHRVFDAFTQVDASMTRRHGGSGLGLAICKQLVERMGGRIGVHSLPGEGSVFWFTVRLDNSTGPALSAPAEPALPAPAGNGSYAGGRILLVEDNEINAEVVLEILSSTGYHCDLARTGRAAVEAVLGRRYDLVLMDCQLPEMDGFEAARQMRKRGHPVPIIALTACATRGDHDKCRAAGMDDYISKPVAAERLLRLISFYLNRNLQAKAQRESRPSANQASAAPAGAERAANLETALARVEGRTAFLRKVAGQFLRSASESLASIRQALTQRDPQALASAAHRLKGEAATFAAGPVVHCAEELEGLAERRALTAAEDLLPRLTVALGRLHEELAQFVAADGS